MLNAEHQQNKNKKTLEKRILLHVKVIHIPTVCYIHTQGEHKEKKHARFMYILNNMRYLTHNKYELYDLDLKITISVSFLT